MPITPENPYTVGQPVTTDNVRAFEAYYRKFTPRYPDYDAGLRTFLGFLSSQLAVFGETPKESIQFPVSIYDQSEILDIEGLKSAVFAAAKAQKMAIKDRGRGQYDQVGQHFWNHAEDIQDMDQRLATKLWAAAEALGVTSEEWFRNVVNPSR